MGVLMLRTQQHRGGACSGARRVAALSTSGQAVATACRQLPIARATRLPAATELLAPLLGPSS
jgi:hypothetical protein